MVAVECVWCGEQSTLDDRYGERSDWNYVCEVCTEELEQEDSAF